VVYHKMGKVQRPALILKNAEGKYDHIAVYASKEAAEPLYVLENDVYTPNCYDTVPYKGGEVNVVRNARLLEIAEDGSYVRAWAGNASDADNSDCWYPRWVFDKVKAACGPPSASSMSSGQDPDLILKCSGEQWAQCAQWQADAMIYMMENEGVEVVFSHFHGPDLSGHSYMKYLKNRDTSKQDESVVREWHANTYKWTDDYIGRFIPYVEEKGWTILVVSDHALICPESEPNEICDNSGVNIGVMKELGFTVLKKDENGNEIQEIDWEKTVAVQSATNTIHLNLKGRDRYGIVDPADKYEVEEQIITALYGYRDKKTGKRVVSVALHEKDAVLLGMAGGDIMIMIHEDYNFDHGESLSTACGHNDTSVSPIFVAAGPGVKQGHEIKGYVREVDVAPTAAVLLGVNIPKDCEGAPAYQIFTERM
ncbi:MAG: alkaline phosphatase family protein, partial [Peptococcaceae bacterium]|nr:alkaline phosphatase family protein [Peptococcaceae bacterium]